MTAVGGVAGRRAGPGAEGRGLAEPDFAAQAVNGFGDPANSYVHCMTEFRGSVYVGTSRHSMALLKLFPPPEPPPMEPWPVAVPDSVEDLDMHGQIWRLRPDPDEWSRAFTSPDIVGRKGHGAGAGRHRGQGPGRRGTAAAAAPAGPVRRRGGPVVGRRGCRRGRKAVT
jgi:hypothetical protein